jgi:metallo-beta-lactamase family protein
MTVTIGFHGAAGTVTGSCYRIEHPKGAFLVDCGLFQGNRTVSELNSRALPFDARETDFLLLTHSHIDHIGLTPKLVGSGFEGPIHATAPSVDLLKPLLADSAKIQESEAERVSRRNRRKGKAEVAPIYTLDDARTATRLAQGHALEAWFEPGPGVRARFWNAGHILGSSSIEAHVDPGDGGAPLRLLFSGDLGPDEKVFHLEPDAPAGFDYVLCESTYGDRDRADATVVERRANLKREIADAMARGGNLLIPAFAVERTQELLHDIGVLMAEGGIPRVPLYVDSPLAREVTNVFVRHATTMPDVELDADALFRDPSFHFAETVDESRAINAIEGGAIIMAASGMCDAGRIRHHLRHNLWRENATVLFVGYQAPGTLGQIIKSGEPEVRINGRTVEVRATIREIGNYSAHADQGELVAWVEARLPVHGAIFLTHGEDKARAVLKEHVVAAGCDGDLIVLPQLDETFALERKAPSEVGRRPRVDARELERDWHNDYAAFILELGRRLEDMDDTARRRDLLARLEGALRG